MRKAAGKTDFEKAAELRNMIDDLRDTTKPTRRFTRGSLPSSIDPMADVQALADALQLPRPPPVMECFDISNISTHARRCFDGLLSRTACRTRTITGAIACAPSKGRMILPAWPKSFDGRYSRMLLEARAANPEAAEFSQEGTVDAMRAIEEQPLRLPNGRRQAERSALQLQKRNKTTSFDCPI